MKFHQQLNDKFWDKDNDNQMRPEVLAKLKEIANAFIEYIEIPEDAVLDIVVTGSSASYNYNKYSDLDLHIIVDYNKIHEDCPLVEGYLGALKNTFNKEHDIFIKDVPVELYAEKQGQGTVHNGLYSVQKEEWIDRPEKIAPTDNDAAVDAKFNEIKDMVDKCDDSEVATELLEKIYNMRKAGLAESGEFCTENLAFKKLRNEGCMDKLRKLKKEQIDKQLSLESYNESLEQDVKELTKTDDYYKVDGSRVSIKNGFGSQVELMDLQNLGKKLEKKGYKVYCSNYYIDAKKNESTKEDYPKNREELINKYKGVFKKNGITLEISNLYNKKEDNFSGGFGKSYNVEGKVFNKFEKAIEYMKKLSNKNESIKENKMNEGFKKLIKTEQEIEKILQQNGFKTSEVHKDKGELIKLWYVEKDVKLDGLQHEIGTKVEGKDFKEILKKVKAAFVKNESLQESSIIDRFKELVNKIAKDFKEQGYPKSKKFLLDFVDEAVKEFNTFNDYKIKVSTDNGTAVLTLADMYQGRINAERKTVKFTDLENSNYAYESLNNNLQQLICEAIECKEPYETQEEINGFKLCSFFGYHYANAVYAEEKETGKTVGWDQYENELYLEGPNMETKTYELAKQPELTANVEEVKNMLPSILADGNIENFPVYQFLEKISQINKDILENYPIYWDKNHEGNREPIKNEDVATLADKVDQANNDLQDIIKSLNNEALQEPVEIGTRVGTPDGQTTGTVKEVNVADKTVKIDTDEIPGKGKEEKVFKIEELDNIIKEALEE